MEHTYRNTRVTLVQGDITQQQVDAIVNAANSGLSGGSGVDGAIHKVGGPTIAAECKTYFAEHGRVEPGRCAVTTAGDLPAKHVIHAVGPKFNDGQHGEYVTLERAYLESLAAADKVGATSIAFPSISTGAYRFPIDEAALVAFGSMFRYLRGNEKSGLTEIRMVTFSDADLEAYRKAFSDVVRTHLG